MKHDYSIECDHIILMPMSLQTSELYRQLRNREDNREFFFNSTIIEREQQEAWFQNYLKKETEYMFSVVHKLTGSFIGGIGIYDIDSSKRTAEIGRIIIDKELAAGKGYGTEAINGLAEISQNKLNLNKVYAYIYGTNIASIKAFLKAGFVEDAAEKDNDIIKVCRPL